jgi:glycosyltransferase involved in cell wall biosynthesis
MRLGLDVRLTYYQHGGISKYIQRMAALMPQLAPAHTHLHFYRRGHTASFSPAAQRVACWTPAHHRLERWALSAELLPYRLDIFHSPDFIPPQFGYRRSVITVHDLAFLRYPQFLTAESRRHYNGQIQSAAQRAHAIVTISNATRADVIERLHVPESKVETIYLGVDTEFSPRPMSEVQATLARYTLPTGYVLFVGTFEPRKNVPALLRAYARLRDVPPLVLVGNSGWLFEATQYTLAELKLEARVRILENVPEAELPALYSGAGVFVLPSHYEGFGLPVLEAMGCGVPVVIADRPALAEVAGEAALRVNPHDAESIADALTRALSDSRLRADLIARGTDRARAFPWENTAQQTLALYERINPA